MEATNRFDTPPAEEFGGKTAESHDGDGFESIGQTAKGVAQSAKDVAQTAKDAVVEKVEEFRKAGAERAQQLEGWISEEPWKAVAIAIGLGVLLGCAVKSR